MKTITIDIAEGGEVICNDTNLGRAGEHHNTKLHIIIADKALSECDYFRCWFGNKYSTDLSADNSQIMYKIPQDALVPPTVDFQLCGYKAENGIPYVVARSSVITFKVDESACCSLISEQAFEPFEVMLYDCENAAKSAKESQTAASNSASQARDYCTATMEVYDKIPDFQSEIENKADKVFGNEVQYMGFEADETVASAITPDTAPKKDSTRLITSGAMYDEIENISNRISMNVANLLNEIGEKADASYVDEKIGSIETILDEIINIQKRLLGSIKFTLQNVEQTLPAESTWSDWINSEYNSDGAVIQEDGRLYWWLGNVYLYDQNGEIQYASDKIINGGVYEWKQ